MSRTRSWIVALCAWAAVAAAACGGGGSATQPAGGDDSEPSPAASMTHESERSGKYGERGKAKKSGDKADDSGDGDYDY